MYFSTYCTVTSNERSARNINRWSRLRPAGFDGRSLDRFQEFAVLELVSDGMGGHGHGRQQCARAGEERRARRGEEGLDVWWRMGESESEEGKWEASGK